ncbi:MAG TPA: hypothetical protein VD905_16260 [Flavobacteriales bacterium]|nr:hypothetical protein [Flavobacteriales bacterium]
MIKAFSAFAVLFFTGFTHSRAQTDNKFLGEAISETTYRTKWEYALQYTAPTSKTNKIRVIQTDVFFWKRYFKKIIVNMSFGISLVQANGYVNKIQETTSGFETVQVNTQGTGLGPQTQLQFLILRFNRFSIEGEGNGSFLFFNRKFPVGGTHYNLMFRTGPNVCLDVSNKYRLKAGYRWLHASNGMGYGNQNPYYEGQGIVLSLAYLIR